MSLRIAGVLPVQADLRAQLLGDVVHREAAALHGVRLGHHAGVEADRALEQAERRREHDEADERGHQDLHDREAVFTAQGAHAHAPVAVFVVLKLVVSAVPLTLVLAWFGSQRAVCHVFVPRRVLRADVVGPERQAGVVDLAVGQGRPAPDADPRGGAARRLRIGVDLRAGGGRRVDGHGDVHRGLERRRLDHRAARRELDDRLGMRVEVRRVRRRLDRVRARAVAAVDLVRRREREHAGEREVQRRGGRGHDLEEAREPGVRRGHGLRAVVDRVPAPGRLVTTFTLSSTPGRRCNSIVVRLPADTVAFFSTSCLPSGSTQPDWSSRRT